jgi:hypothetical protein
LKLSAPSTDPAEGEGGTDGVDVLRSKRYRLPSSSARRREGGWREEALVGGTMVKPWIGDEEAMRTCCTWTSCGEGGR